MHRIAAATINQTPLDWTNNQARILKLICEAKTANVDFLCFPELCISGYGCEDAFFAADTSQKSLLVLKEIINSCDNIIVLVGLPLPFQGLLYNAVAVIQNQKLLGFNLKKNLPREGVHYESRWFHPWKRNKKTLFKFEGQSIPIGDLTYRFGELGVGIEICEEAWGSRSGLNSDECHVVFCPSASHFALEKYQSRVTLVENASRALSSLYVYTNLVGLEAGRLLYDGGSIICERGEIKILGPRFEFGDGSLAVYDFEENITGLLKMRARSVSAEEDVIQQHVVEGTEIVLSKKTTIEICPRSPDWEKNSEFFCAQKLCLWDYLKKSKARGFAVSLSGGSDSALCAILISCVLKERSAAEKLFTFYQGTDNSSDATAKAAEKLADALGCDFKNVDIQEICDLYLDKFSKVFNQPITWDTQDMALQNIQARARAPFAWLVANVYGLILISTGNRSEGAVGYTTMDGDAAGGLAPLAGIDKSFILQWLDWFTLQTECSDPLSQAIKAIRSMPPTAELKPLEDDQQDEKELMPYVVLSEIERLLLRDKLTDFDALKVLVRLQPNISEDQLKQDLKKFWILFKQSQWKRDRLAPSFHLDSFSLDPKGWLRYPIFSGENSQ